MCTHIIITHCDNKNVHSQRLLIGHAHLKGTRHAMWPLRPCTRQASTSITCGRAIYIAIAGKKE